MGNDSGFESKNLIGKKGEYLFARLYQDYKYDVYSGSKEGWKDVSEDVEAQNEDYDFVWYQNYQMIQKIEVKYDTVAYRTGNLFAETKLVYDDKRRGEGVGYMIKSTADILFYFVENLGCYVLNFPILKQFMFDNINTLRQASHRDYQGENGKDAYTAYGYLISIQNLPSNIIRKFIPISEYQQFVDEMK